jgi:F0F1-type ATP synthase membrane subunit b/b'
MASALDAHLRDIETEARQADREVDEYRERADRRIEELNREVEAIVARSQRERALLQEDIERKETRARKKWDAVTSFKVILIPLPLPMRGTLS